MLWFSSGLNLTKQLAIMFSSKSSETLSQPRVPAFWGCTIWLEPCSSWWFQGFLAPRNGDGTIYPHNQPAPVKTHKGAFWVAQDWWQLDFNSRTTQDAAEIPACTRVEFHRVIEDQSGFQNVVEMWHCKANKTWEIRYLYPVLTNSLAFCWCSFHLKFKATCPWPSVTLRDLAWPMSRKFLGCRPSGPTFAQKRIHS